MVAENMRVALLDRTCAGKRQSRTYITRENILGKLQLMQQSH